jgi:hypothetical protein
MLALRWERRFQLCSYADVFSSLTGRRTELDFESHTIETPALTYTEVARTDGIRSYLHGVRQGRGEVAGASGNYAKLTRASWASERA